MLLSSVLLLLTVSQISKCRTIPATDSSNPDQDGTIQADGTLILLKSPPTIDNESPTDKDNGTSSFFSPQLQNFTTPLCSRGSTFSCLGNNQPVEEPPSFILPDGTQKEWGKLDPSFHDQIWDAAGSAGTALKTLMDDWVGRGASRSGAAQDAILDANYFESMRARWENYDVTRDSYIKDIAAQARMPQILAAGMDFTYVSWYANENAGAPTVAMQASSKAKMIITAYAYASKDLNVPGSRAYSSTITWNAWKKITGPENARGLKWQLQHAVANQASNNIMSLAHLKYGGPGSKNVFPLPPDSFDGRPPASPIAGHGVWRPEDPAFTHLLAAPNVKTMVQMVVDVSL